MNIKAKFMGKKSILIEGLIVILFATLFFLIGVAIQKDRTIDCGPVANVQRYEPMIAQEEAVIRVVEKVSPAVVSIIITRDLPIIGRHLFQRGQAERFETGGGTGFIVSSDGLVLTNRHVVADLEAEYTILTNDGRRFEAEVVARDPIQDLAMIRIKGGNDFPTVKIGDPSKIRIGQTAIAIGNSLGEFRNTVSVGVVSGLGRSISATDGRTVRVLKDVIQTDAAINMGNSGGPLLNLRGEVIGINTAMAIDAQNIGFSLTIDKAQRMIHSVISGEELTYPFLGIRYLMIDWFLQIENNLSTDHGAWIVGGVREPAIVPNSAADQAGLKEGDIIVEFDGIKIDRDNHLAFVILRYNPGDEVELRVMRGAKEIVIRAVLGGKAW